ncbi:MAG TPA: hypothetical protein VEZ11_04885 [Thermoanaerobaculia bacterium]|nr:hypothetical protein [Thermoanaerobaculia bacterium]
MRRVALLIGCALLIAGPLHAAETWWEAYLRGVAAVRNGRYAAGAPALARAIAEMPAENAHAREHDETFAYLPHFWLGVAKLNLGDADGALRELKTSEEQGAVQGTPQFAQLRETMARAQSAQQRGAEPAAADARKATDAAISRAMLAQTDALGAGADRSEGYRAAQRKLQEALDQSKRAGSDVRALQLAADAAGQARDLFASAADDARKQKAARPPAGTKPQVAGKTPGATSTMPVTTDTSARTKASTADEPAPVESEGRVAARIALQQYRRRLVDASVSAGADGGLRAYLQTALRDAARIDSQIEGTSESAALQRISDEVVKRDHDLDVRLAAAHVPRPPATTSTQSTPVPAPATPSSNPASADEARTRLETAYRAFARGDLDSADKMLSDLIAAKPSPEAFLLRGCARYTRALMTRTPEAQLDGAKADFVKALDGNHALRLDPRVFSPKLIAFFEKLRK